MLGRRAGMEDGGFACSLAGESRREGDAAASELGSGVFLRLTGGWEACGGGTEELEVFWRVLLFDVGSEG